MSRTLLSCLGIGLAATALTTPGGFAAPFLGGLAGNVAGNLATDLFKALDRRVAERLLDGWSGVDENHHVDRALRLAHINGLRAVLKRFNTARIGDPDVSRQREAERVSDVLTRFLDRETEAAQTSNFGRGSDVTVVEQAIRQAVLRVLPDAFDQTLATRRETGDRSAMIKSLTQLRAAVEAAVLEEIRLQAFAKGEDFPASFRTAFNGTASDDGWFDLFVREAAVKIKEGPEFERVWNAEQVALIKAIVASHTKVFAGMDAKLGAMQDTQVRQTAIAERTETKINEILDTLPRTAISIVDATAQRFERRTDKIDEVTQRIEARLEATPRIEAKIDALLQGHPAKGGVQITPVLEKVITEILATARKGAAEGNVLYKEIVDLMYAGQHAHTEHLFYALAVEKGQQANAAAKEAALAYRNLGAIAGLTDPNRALNAYQMALKFDPDDWESMIWVGSLQLDRGTVSEAENSFRRVLLFTRTKFNP